MDPEPRPALLVSLHDVSPLTLAASREMVEVVAAAGLEPRQLTLLVVPFHEGRVRLHEDRETATWLRGLSDAGATLVLHGLTHRMPERTFNPLAWFWGYGFARGQGELYQSDTETARRCLAEGREIVQRAGLPEAAAGFVPPAWLLSAAARAEVERSGFAFYETLAGIVCRGARRAQRLVGWGSLTRIEAAATSVYSAWQCRRQPRDTRLALHPVDMARPMTRASIVRALARLRGELLPRSYASYLAPAGSDAGA